ncbi:hypothetical protein FACS1894152_2450 [Bacilli bacterium]|nr:hypothetical protein FACS1894152_2450 [Bacilli bacterium]
MNVFYGCKLNISRISDNRFDIFYSSYADPKITNTFKVYRNIGEFLRNFEIPDEDFESMKMKAFSKFMSPKTNLKLAAEALTRYIINMTDADVEQRYRAVKNLTKEDIRRQAMVFEQCIKDSHIATVGAKEGIESNKELYDEIK